MNKVLITGADGFVGSYTVNEFLANGVEVCAVDLAQSPRRLKKQPGLEYFQCDISKGLETLMHKYKNQGIDTFIHFAWAGSAGPQRTDYRLQLDNAACAVECLKVAKDIGCSRFLCAGSIMEYEVEAVVHAQGQKPGMGYIYGMGKHTAHSLCKAVAANLGIDLLWPMITNAYGVGELSPRFINTTLRKIIADAPLEFTAATQNYDFVYVSDVARAFYLIAEHGIPFSEYMIGSGQAAPLKEFILRMINTCAPDARPLFGNVPYTGINMSLERFDCGKLKQDCGFEPEVTFEEGITRTMQWIKEYDRKISI